MNDRNQEIYSQLMRHIKSEILRRQGSGFTVELAPEIRDITTYKYAEKPFSGNRYWKKDMSPLGHYSGSLPGDWPIKLTPVLKRALPKEIEVIQSPPTLLVDTRNTEKLTTIASSAYKVTGCRVHLTVPDNYAAKVYREVYTDIGIPFRDTLLTKHRELLLEIISKDLREPCSFYMTFNLMAFYIGYDDYYYLTFESKGMQPLTSIGQMYGMALALIESIKEYYPTFLLNRTVEINYLFRPDYWAHEKNVDEINVLFKSIDPPTPKIELKAW